MPKRFTATEKWKDLWFKKLEPKNKLLWIYLLDECDNAGLIELDLQMASFQTGFTYSIEEVRETYKTRLYQVSEDVWFIPKFIFFQYPKGLRNNDNVTKNVVIKLQKYNLITPNLDLKETYCISNVDIQVMVKDKDKDMVMVKEGGAKNFKIIPPLIEQIIERANELKYPDVEIEANKFYNHYSSNGWKVGKNKMVDWSCSLTNWYTRYAEKHGLTIKDLKVKPNIITLPDK